MLYAQDDEPDYPCSDGKPMAESDLHRQMMTHLIESLAAHFRGREVYVSGNLMLYYERGNPKACLSPDVLVTLDRPSHPREIYKLWEEGKMPEFVIEVTSRTTRRKDIHHKKALYEMLGVQEYLLFDPRGDYLEPRFQVFRRGGSGFLSVLAPATTGYTSPLLDLTFRPVADELRIFDSQGRLLPTLAELAERAEQEAARAEQETTRAEQEAARAEQETARAEQEAARAQQEAARAEQETARAERAEAELARLRELLERLGPQGQV